MSVGKLTFGEMFLLVNDSYQPSSKETSIGHILSLSATNKAEPTGANALNKPFLANGHSGGVAALARNTVGAASSSGANR